MSQGKWVEFNENFDEGVRNNYEIFDTYPHNIRKKDTKRILTFGLNPYGYYHCSTICHLPKNWRHPNIIIAPRQFLDTFILLIC